MAQKKKYGSVKRFGSRYGRRIREQTGAIEQDKRKKHECPYCRAQRVKRVSNGVFECRKCKKVFTGKAYAPREEARVQATQNAKEATDEPEEEVQE